MQSGQVYKQQRTEAAATSFQLGVPSQQHQPRQLPTLLPNLPQVVSMMLHPALLVAAPVTIC